LKRNGHERPTLVGERFRRLLKEKKFSQGDIEKRTGLLRAHISIGENGHITPTIQTLEKFARALEVPLHRFVCDSDKPPKALNLLRQSPAETEWGDRRQRCKIAQQTPPTIRQN